MYRDIAPFDPEENLQDEFLNSRGAIARFSRNTIEIRLLDIQECPRADLAILQVLVAVLQQLMQGRWASYKQQQSWHAEELAEIFLEVIRQGMGTVISNASFLHDFGMKQTTCTTRELWQHLWELVRADLPEEVNTVMEAVLKQGNLAERITAAVGPEPEPAAITAVYRKLADCLASGSLFSP
jgi:hypothetical protein